jgi:hypothetical protein
VNTAKGTYPIKGEEYMMITFPGSRLGEMEESQIMKELLGRINPDNLETGENIKNWMQVDDQVLLFPTEEKGWMW